MRLRLRSRATMMMMMINDGDDETPSSPNNPKKHSPLLPFFFFFVSSSLKSNLFLFSVYPTSPAAMNPPAILPCILLSLAALFSISAAVTSSASLPLQVIGLLSLKSSLNDPHSTFRDWGPAPSFSKPDFQDPVWCTWSGVKCDSGMSHVTSLNLSRRNLSGMIPPELRYLTGLLHLNLSGNSFEGPFPSFVFELTELRTIDVSHNSFNSSFTPGISKLKFLKVFNGYSNNFSGPLPIEFTSLRYMECLNLGGSYFEGEIPPVYASFPALRSLYLHGNYLEGSVPPELGSLSQLEHLEIGYNLYYGSLPGEFGSLSNLRYLDISSANLSGSLPREIGDMTRLETIFLFRNQLTGDIPESISRLVALRSLDLSENQITGRIPVGVASFRNLTLLNLMKNNLSGEIPEGIGSLPELSTLLLWNNGITGMLPQNLGANANLTWVDVSTNLLTGPVPPNLCLGNMLIKLFLFSNGFEDELPKSLVNCTSLFRLRIQGNNLRGAIPRGFGLLSNLTFADFSRNNFSGDIPDDLGDSLALKFLNISGNSFESVLPGSIWRAPNLLEFSASSAGLIGSIPDFIGCKSLYKIELGENSLNGSIPWDIGHCEKLVNLNLSRNSLTGIIPWEISALPSITELDLSQNFLSGTVPSNFDNCTTLESFNVSFNSLTGPIPSSGAIFRNLHPSSFLGNEGLCGGVLEKPCGDNTGSKDREIRHPQPRRTAGAIVWIMAAALGVGLIVIISGGRRCFHSNYGSTLNQGHKAGPWKLTAFQRLNFTAEDVIDCLSMSDKIIGMGSTGTVYRAEMPNGDVIAVKKLWGRPKEHTRSRRGVLAEVDVLRNVRHRNIVRLLGCCSNRECTMLLYEYMPNGNLDDLLHGKNKDLNLVTDWLTRYKIALGVAQGICYLHHDCDPVIVHRDLKPSNILLDAEMEARVADFGVAKLIQCDESMSVIAGSYGYIAPEYAYTLQVDEKSDIYSYGVVLMEMLCGKRSVDPEFGEGNSIVNWVRSKAKTREGIYEMLDRDTGASCASVRQEMIELLRIALLCTTSNPADRPSMRDVVMMLQKAGPRRKLTQPFGREDGDPPAKKTDAGC